VNKNKIGVLASCALLAITLAACGKSSSTTSGTTASTSSSSATISGAGSTFAAPVYQQWGSGISGLTVNYNPVGSGRYHGPGGEDRGLRCKRSAAEARRIRNP
jgi:ABC-type phosphate transport system substrate-binding protein